MVQVRSISGTRGPSGPGVRGTPEPRGGRLRRPIPSTGPGWLHRPSISHCGLGKQTPHVSHPLLRPITLGLSRLDNPQLLRMQHRLELSTWADLTPRAPDGERSWLDLPTLLSELNLPSSPPPLLPSSPPPLLPSSTPTMGR